MGTREPTVDVQNRVALSYIELRDEEGELKGATNVGETKREWVKRGCFICIMSDEKCII